jgi:2-hydroxy-6-oxonona-2,4-dienedioate hydrolase
METLSAAEGDFPGVPLGEAAASWVSSRWVDVEGRAVRYREAGEGMPIVLVHGLGVSADYWVRNGPSLAAGGFRALALDLPGFGRTEGPPGGLGVGRQATAIARWAEALGLPGGVYLGHSLSCQSVLELAVRWPGLVRGLVLAAPTGEGPARRRLIQQAIGLARDVPRESLKLAMLVAQAYFRAGPGRVLRTWKLGAEHDPLELLPRVTVPVLVVVGDADPVVDIDFADSVARELPTGELARIPGGTHAVIFEPTGTFNAAVLDFLGRVASAAPDPL